MKYIKVEWPEIQDYMDHPNYPEECFFDPQKNVWFIPENWNPDYLELKEKKKMFLSLLNEIFPEVSICYTSNF